MNKTNDPSRLSWVEYDITTDFPIQNIPFGIMKHDNEFRVCSRIGDYLVDLVEMLDLKFFLGIPVNRSHFQNQYLNDFIALGKPVTNAVRDRISEVLEKSNGSDAQKFKDKFLISTSSREMSIPVKIGDYTDFYSSREHATNVGMMFRDPQNALLPNWLHIPVGYHGRASSIVVSGKDVIRPKGQQMPAEGSAPVFGPCRQLDFELELGFVVGKPNNLGESIPVNNAEDHIFGLTLFNDWSARDIQKWEYVPLGPFLSKNFASTISPWIVTLEALEPFRTEGPVQEPEVLPYLQFEGRKNFDINLTVSITPDKSLETVVSQSNFKYMYWNMAQQLAHHTCNGCNMNVGDICASGTISGPTPDSYGSMLEIAWKGTRPVQMKDGSTRVFIQDGDTVSMTGFAQKDHIRIGFGECKAKILPAN